MEVDKNKIEKQTKKAFEVADSSHAFTYRAIITGAKRLIDYGFKASEHRGIYGRDLTWQKTKRLAKHTADINSSMHKMVSDLLDEIDSLSSKMAKENLGSIPEDKWDKDKYMASIMFSDTFNSRTQKYTEKLKNEVLDFIRVCQEEKMSADQTFRHYVDYLKKPQDSDLIASGIIAGYIKNTGSGVYRSFADLNDDVITRGFHTANRYYWESAEAKCVIAQKDASTCSICSDLDGKVFPINEDVLPVHLRCRCWELPLLKRRDFDKL